MTDKWLLKLFYSDKLQKRKNNKRVLQENELIELEDEDKPLN